MTLAAMASQRLMAARRIRFLTTRDDKPFDETSLFILRRWCRATVRIRIELVKQHRIRAVRPWLLNGTEIKQLFSLGDNHATVWRIMNAVCNDVRASGVALVALVEIDEELVITFATQ